MHISELNECTITVFHDCIKSWTTPRKTADVLGQTQAPALKRGCACCSQYRRTDARHAGKSPMVAVALGLFLLLNAGADDPSGTTAADGVLVSRKEIALLKAHSCACKSLAWHMYSCSFFLRCSLTASSSFFADNVRLLQPAAPLVLHSTSTLLGGLLNHFS